MTQTLILMYHRICARTLSTRCWFERGTAVDPEVAAAQINWLCPHVRFLRLSDAVDELFGDRTAADERPACVVTLDDGYRDALGLRALDVPLTLFPVADHLAESARLLFFDEYYSLLHSAQIRGPVSLAGTGLETSTGPSPADDLRWWVRGPMKEALHTTQGNARDHLLGVLRERLDAPSIPSPSSLYLSRSELRALLGTGHEIGGHGTSHQRLAGVGPETLQREVAGAAALLDSLGASRRRAFCWPDGSVDHSAEEEARRRGFHSACAVTEGAADGGSPRWRLPRILMRNVLPGAAQWPGALQSVGAAR